MTRKAKISIKNRSSHAEEVAVSYLSLTDKKKRLAVNLIMRAEVQGSFLLEVLVALAVNFLQMSSQRLMFQTGSHPHQHGFIAERIGGLSLCPALCNNCYPCKSNCK